MSGLLRARSLPLLILAVGILVAVASGALADNIDPSSASYKYAWGENVGWISAKPAGCSGCGVTVTGTKLTGYMWGENIGWVNMNCENTYGPGCPGSPAGVWRVTNDGTGNLAGFAWGENVGWINFSCKNHDPSPTCASVGNFGVSIGPSGVFSGYAWGENVGWIKFDASSLLYKMKTAWPDSDSDGVTDVAETACGGDPNNPARRPERVDGVFAGVDDNGNGQIDEALPPGASTYDCDGDGYTGAAEDHVYAYKPQMNGDQKTCQEYDAAFPNASVKPSLRWPADLMGGTFSGNKVNIQDLAAYVGTPRYLNTNVGTNPGDVRFDVVPGHTFGNDINLADLQNVAFATAPMLGGVRMFNGPSCPYAP